MLISYRSIRCHHINEWNRLCHDIARRIPITRAASHLREAPEQYVSSVITQWQPIHHHSATTEPVLSLDISKIVWWMKCYFTLAALDGFSGERCLHRKGRQSQICYSNKNSKGLFKYRTGEVTSFLASFTSVWIFRGFTSIYRERFVVLKSSRFCLVLWTVYYVNCVTSEEDKCPTAKLWAGDHITPEFRPTVWDLNPRRKHSQVISEQRRILNISTPVHDLLLLWTAERRGVRVQTFLKAMGQEESWYWNGFLAGLV